jgi:tyrosine-specific transport protein
MYISKVLKFVILYPFKDNFMQKKVGAIMLVAGTCIGSGMIALPMVLAKLGLILSVLLMIFIWFIMYHSSLFNLELNLQAGEGLPLGVLGKRFSGRVAEWIGVASLKLLSYALLAAFIYGGSSILQKLLHSNMGEAHSFSWIATCYAGIAMLVLLLPLKLLDYINRMLFIALIGIAAILIIGLTMQIEWTHLPLFAKSARDISVWTLLLPVVFTSFGFQVIFHTLTNYCKKEKKILNSAFLWGSFIPAIVYILWTCSVLSVVYHNDPTFYSQMVEGKVEVGALIQTLSTISGSESVQFFIWWVSMLAIATSVLGVGLGLCDAIKGMLIKKVPHFHARSVVASIATILPAYLVVIYVPNAFIAALGFAGMILAVIAILLPIYLFSKIQAKTLHYPILRRKWLLQLSLVIGIALVASELWNML